MLVTGIINGIFKKDFARDFALSLKPRKGILGEVALDRMIRDRK
jgi:hypothetical protein